ncbi:MAG: sugar phosphate isomerase/epimerase [Treponema sp.]|jgi:sugar phosphate isomerase/epimerase|nr:sugar phosphate isomerase/epimerase [Treponema sp.]
MKKGFQQFTVRDLLTSKAETLSVFKKLRSLGYDSIHGYTLPIFTLAEYKEMTREAGLENITSGGDFEAMRDGTAAIKQAVADAKFLGTSLVGVGTLPKAYRESEEGYRRYAAEINRIAEALKSEGLKIIYHPHAIECFSLGGGLKGLDIMINETDHEAVLFCLDTHWLACAGVSVIEYIRLVRGRMPVIHVKDYAIVKAAVDKVEEVHKQFAEVGEGNLNWPSIIAACRETGVEYAVVEQDYCAAGPLESLTTSITNLIAFGV